MVYICKDNHLVPGSQGIFWGHADFPENRFLLTDIQYIMMIT
jgi:hypothetical protein